MLPHLDLALLIQTVGYVGLFAIIFAESGTIIAFFLPGASLLFTAGFLASQGYLNIFILVPLLGIAAFLGDNVGYWFGKHVGPRIFTREDSRFFHKKHIDRTREFYARYGSKTILIARFIPFVRTFAPILAGVGSMHYPTFIFYNIIGALLWACGITTLGYTLGSVLPGASKYLELIVLTIIAITLMPAVFEFLRARRKTLPKVVMFDLDNTLTDAKQNIEPSMAARLATLSQLVPVVVMSGQMWSRFQEQLLAHLPSSMNTKNLYLMPNNAADCYRFENGWEKAYSNTFSESEKQTIMNALEEVLNRTQLLAHEPQWGERIEDRGSQIALSALGQQAPLAEKKAWDPDRKKREILWKELSPRLPDFKVQIAGITTIDITRKGIDKALGVRWIAEHLHHTPKDMLYVGDALFEGGNDAVVIPTGIQTRQVASPEETARIIDGLISRV